MITKDDRRHMIASGEVAGWKVSFGDEFDTLHFHRASPSRFVDIYFDRAGMVISEAWCDLGRMEPDVRYIVDYLEKRGSDGA